MPNLKNNIIEEIKQIADDFSIEQDSVETEDTSSLAAIEKPFDPRKIDIDAKILTLDLIVKRIKSGEIDLFPDFQRHANLWDQEKQSRLIESILIRIPLPAFYFDGTNDNKWLVVDGLQRLSTIKNFIIDKSSKLNNLEFLTQFQGLHFDELPRDLQRRIDETQITAYIIKPGTPSLVKFNIFKRINTGGLVLQPQEIRHALNQGIPAQFVAELASLKEFKEATSNIKEDRMLDRDFVTRFLAFYINDFNNYKPDLDTFMNETMASLNNHTIEFRNKLKENFKKSMLLAKQIFGEHAFRKRYTINDKRRKPLNKALFETWSTAFAKMNDDDRLKLLKNKEKVNKEFINLMNNSDVFVESLTSATGDKKKILIRFSHIENLIEEILLNDK